ncbi:phosphoketolase [Pseudomonas kilonensis]|jgi:phosphoketolase
MATLFFAENVMSDFLSPDQLEGIDGYRRASNYLAVGQIYLKDNPLLRKPLQQGHVKPRLLGSLLGNDGKAPAVPHRAWAGHARSLELALDADAAMTTHTPDGIDAAP